MQKTAIAFVALPFAFAAAGYAGGQVVPVAAPSHATTARTAPVKTKTAAAQVLDRLADEEAEKAKMATDEGTKVPSEAHTEAAFVPAEETPKRSNANVVRLGRISVPIYRAHAVTYVISEIGVEMRDKAAVERFTNAENASRLRDAVLASLHGAAQGMSLTGAGVDSPKLAERLGADLREDFGADVGGVLLLSLLQADVPRS